MNACEWSIQRLSMERRRPSIALIFRLGMILFLGWSITGRAADEPLDAPLPEITARQLAARIRESWRSYDRGLLEVSFDVEDKRHNRHGIPVVPGSSDTVLVRYAGRFRYAHDGRRWRLAHDGQSIGSNCQLFPDHWATGFDGETHYQIDDGGKTVVLGESKRDAAESSPRGLIWPDAKTLTESLDYSKPAISQRTVDGVRCYVAVFLNDEFLISPRQSHLVIRFTTTTAGKIVESRRLEGIRRDPRGFWVPGRIVIEERTRPRIAFEPPPDFPARPGGEAVATRKAKPLPPGPLPLEIRRTFRITRYDPRKVFRPEDFAFEVPHGATVADRRAGYAYVNDPWWPEVQAMLKERFANWFEWPIVNMSPLNQFTPPTLEGPNQVEGKPAPRFEVDTWINTGPLDWARLKGKVVLVKFWSLDRYTWGAAHSNGQQHAALRELYETYQPAGFEIVAIHENTGDAEAVRQFVRELKLPYAVAVDSAKPGHEQATSWAFNDGGHYIVSVLVDHTGKVHAIPEGRLVETLVDLLKQAGAADVSADMVREYRLPREALAQIQATWWQRVKDAKGDARIVGTVTDERGRPVADVPVRATLQLKVLETPFPRYYFVSEFPTPWTTRTGPDGRFEIKGLCKGRYQLEITAPGKAAVGVETVIAPDRRSAPVNVAVGQPQGIAGFVHLGKSRLPMPFALVFVLGHQSPDGDHHDNATPFAGVANQRLGRISVRRPYPRKV